MPLRTAIRRLETALISRPRHRVIHLLGRPSLPPRSGPGGIEALVRASLRTGRIRILRVLVVAVAPDLADYHFPMPDLPIGPPT